MDASGERTRFPSPDDLANVARGMLMGGADIIPGVSGGTVALILGIYGRLVTSLSRVDAALLFHLRQARWQDAIRYLDLRFLIPLAIGIGAGVALLGTLMHVLLEEHRQLTLAAFFGLIAASSYLVARLVPHWRGLEVILAFTGALFAVWLVSRPALASPPEALWYVFLCGTVAICAMILPGISGAFILLILGKYHDITGIIKDALRLQLTGQSLATISVFALGCLIGLLSFTKLLKWLLSGYGSVTMAVLCGFMAGSLYKIWPFQIDTTPQVTEFKHKIFEPVSPGDIPLDGNLLMTVMIGGLAATVVIVIDRVSRPPSTGRSADRMESSSPSDSGG